MNSEFELWIRPGEIDFAPATLPQEVLQNVLTLCTTAKYSVPMDRAVGVEAVFVDEMVNRARAKYSHEVIAAVRKFEPRAQVTRVEFTGDLDGHVYPKVWVKIDSRQLYPPHLLSS